MGGRSINTTLCGKKLNLLAFVLFTDIDVFLTSEPATGGFVKHRRILITFAAVNFKECMRTVRKRKRITCQ